MIIVAMPRTGATRICMDIAEEKNLIYAGELIPYSLRDLKIPNYKRIYHETKNQPVYRTRDFYALLEDHSQHVVLSNFWSFANLPTCSHIILRKNMRNAFLSHARFCSKFSEGTVGQELYMSFMNLRAIVAYLIEFGDDKVIWYEDYFPNWPDQKEINRDAENKYGEMIDNLFESHSVVGDYLCSKN